MLAHQGLHRDGHWHVVEAGGGARSTSFGDAWGESAIVSTTGVRGVDRGASCSVSTQPLAHQDGATQTVSTFDSVHVGIATQTDDGLMVPVVHHAEARGLWDIAAELSRVSAAARHGSATLQELTGSTITITSLATIGAGVSGGSKGAASCSESISLAVISIEKPSRIPAGSSAQFGWISRADSQLTLPL